MKSRTASVLSVILVLSCGRAGEKDADPEPPQTTPTSKPVTTSTTTTKTTTGTGSSSSGTTTPKATTKIAFTEVNTILTKSCNGTSCHSAGNSASLNVYVDGEAKFKTQAITVIDRVNTKKDMPPTNATATQLGITADERSKIRSFLTQ